VVSKLNGKITDLFHIDRFWFESGRDELISKEFSIDPEIFWKEFRIIDTPDERNKHTWAYPDAELAMRKIKDMGKLTSIITSAPRWIADMEIKKLNGVPHDYYLPLSWETFAIKPDPSGLFHVLKELKMNPEETLYIGNSNDDAYFAKNAGVDFIYLERHEHKFDMEDYALKTIHSLNELFE
jgi:phosphoglycolate phosphatase